MNISVSDYCCLLRFYCQLDPFGVLLYLFSLSGALVLLNVVPCYALDGQWILKALLDLLLPSFICGRQFKRILFSGIIALGTGLLSINIVLALWYLILETSVTSTTSVSSRTASPTPL
ncbi:unnamed protein product [Dibothriocephalus latus]|uniref:Peptidase M50 domain-containing protein n=1 Tax=Dibothriocephalus latus TaxID=60516 RepID=A0A3P7LSQ2_DIBLA|nr:unnamed protein product [Dibothriocephalus latus]